MLGYKKSRFHPEILSNKSTKTLQLKYKINDTEYHHHHHHHNDDNYDDNNNNEEAYFQYEDNFHGDDEAYFDRDDNHYENKIVRRS